MFYIILFALIWLVALVITYESYYDFFDYFMWLFFSSVVSGLFTFLIAAFLNITVVYHYQYTEQRTVQIYSAKSKNGIEGNFVWGSGRINDVDKYSTFPCTLR